MRAEPVIVDYPETDIKTQDAALKHAF